MSLSPKKTTFSGTLPSLTITIEFPNPTPLGVQLVKTKQFTNAKATRSSLVAREVAAPSGFAVVNKLADTANDETKSKLRPGDVLVSVNGESVAPDELQLPRERVLSADMFEIGDEQKEEAWRRRSSIVGFDAVMERIKLHDRTEENPLVLTFTRPHFAEPSIAYPRFFEARQRDSALAVMMLHANKTWRNSFFPLMLEELDYITCTSAIQTVLSHQILPKLKNPILYINVSNLLDLDLPPPDGIFADLTISGAPEAAAPKQRRSSISQEDLKLENIVKSFVYQTEQILLSAGDVRSPKISQLIDFEGMSLSQLGKIKIIRQLYAIFEANYPETLVSCCFFPTNSILAATLNFSLGFVNEKTKNKFVFSDCVEEISKTLGLESANVIKGGGFSKYFISVNSGFVDVDME